jgi:hypothetical protein
VRCGTRKDEGKDTRYRSEYDVSDPDTVSSPSPSSTRQKGEESENEGVLQRVLEENRGEEGVEDAPKCSSDGDPEIIFRKSVRRWTIAGKATMTHESGRGQNDEVSQDQEPAFLSSKGPE